MNLKSDLCYGDLISPVKSSQSIETNVTEKKSSENSGLNKSTSFSSKKGSMEILDIESASVSSNEEELEKVQVNDFSEILSLQSKSTLSKCKSDKVEDLENYKEELALKKIFDCESIKAYSYEPYRLPRIQNLSPECQSEATSNPNDLLNSIMLEKQEEKNMNKPLILNHTERRFVGTLKFYDEKKGFGFIKIEDDSKDTFIHHDDLLKADIDIRMLKNTIKEGVIMISFSYLEYMGRYNRSRKAVE